VQAPIAVFEHSVDLAEHLGLTTGAPQDRGTERPDGTARSAARKGADPGKGNPMLWDVASRRSAEIERGLAGLGMRQHLMVDLEVRCHDRSDIEGAFGVGPALLA